MCLVESKPLPKGIIKIALILMWRSVLTEIVKFHYTRDITPKRATSDGVHLSGLTFGQCTSKETSWRAVDDTMCNLTGLGIKSGNVMRL